MKAGSLAIETTSLALLRISLDEPTRG